jgi:hypothetical protein
MSAYFTETSNSAFVRNPFKVGDKVLTKVRDAEVEAVVTKLWEHYVQVRTPDNELRWRSIYMVWYPGGKPLARPVKSALKAKPASKVPATKSTARNGKNGAAKPKPVRGTRSRKRR